jgi:hypothetical protein
MDSGPTLHPPSPHLHELGVSRMGPRPSILATTALLAIAPAAAAAQMDMPTLSFGNGWRLTAMAQAFPSVTVGALGKDGSPLRETGWYVTQPAIMTNLEAPDARVVLHTTLNFEGVTQRNGELTFGGWGEGFLDKRHPHTLVHELMLSFNVWDLAGGQVSLSGGKGFAPYGTSDPMARPVLKYPTNHHLSQILERWTINASWLRNDWSVEVGVFGGDEPSGPYDWSNIKSFGDSWSTRVARRWGGGSGTLRDWEASASFASLTEYAHTQDETTRLVNVALRRSAPWGDGDLYALLEGSRTFLPKHDDFFSVLGEARYDWHGHQPYARVEYARRPEYVRDGPAGTPEFFRYQDHVDPTGTTRWLISTFAYAYELTGAPWSVRPFVEAQYFQVRGDQGGIVATDLFGSTSFWSLSAGLRIYLGGGPMRMGLYGVLDPMTNMDHDMKSMPADMPMPMPMPRNDAGGR